MGRKKKRHGHWCWACNRIRPNERLSGRGHARHICRECQKLPAEQLAYHQAERNLERCRTWEGIISRKRRKSFNRFLEHSDPRIRKLAQEMLAEDRQSRRMQRVMAGDYDDLAVDLPEHFMPFVEGHAFEAEHEAAEELNGWLEVTTKNAETDSDETHSCVQATQAPPVSARPLRWPTTSDSNS